jgi:CRP-like cAMP-binding protein
MPPSNLILDQLEPETAARFAAHLEPVALEKGAVLHEVGDIVDSVWFPQSGLICVASETLDGESVAGSMIGWDGAYGAFEACGSRKNFCRAHVQVPGRARRIKAAAYREMFEASPALRTGVHKLVEALMVEARQFVACNALHPVDRRLSRVLLEIGDRSRAGNVLPLTQEALSHMLGVQRTTVALSIAELQKAGALRSGRGAVEIVDQARLERLACTCRRTIAYAHGEIYAAEDAVCGA